MITKTFSINEKDIDYQQLDSCARIIGQGGLVVFPTETVYGLGADYMNEAALSRIFEAKGRPADNPIIVHAAEKEQVLSVAKNVTDLQRRVIEELMGGPLTVILEKGAHISKVLTGGLDTIAIRIPDHAVACELIKRSGTLIAAPSANISGAPSGTSYSHIRRDMEGKADAIIRSDKSRIGIESTVLDLTVDPPRILRPGSVTIEQLREHIPNVEYSHGETNKSPGTKYTHYAPHCPMVMVTGAYYRDKINMLLQGIDGVVMTPDEQTDYRTKKIIKMGKTPHEYAHKLYDAIRMADRMEADCIYAAFPYERDGIAQALHNRLIKACGNRCVSADSFNILLVCTGNTCRSPMAEAVLAKMLEASPIFSVSSCGISANVGQPASQNAIWAAKKRGFDLESHRSRQISSQDVEQSNLIITMTAGHKMSVLSMYPECVHRVFTLGELSEIYADVKDPYMRDQEIYEQCLEQLEQMLKKVGDKWINSL